MNVELYLIADAVGHIMTDDSTRRVLTAVATTAALKTSSNLSLFLS